MRASGQGRVGCILWLVALVVFLMIAWKAIPVKIQDAEFGSFLEEQAKFAGSSSAESIKKRVLARAGEMGLPLDPKKLAVSKTSRRVRIACEYTVALEFPFYTYPWRFTHLIDRPVFVI